MSEGRSTGYYKREFWVEENAKYTRPHHRMRKVARITNGLAGTVPCAVLDVGCGPATLQGLLAPNVAYFGIDIAVHDPAPNLKESDVVEEPIGFGDRRFDIVVAQGLFEYLGAAQDRKLAEIAEVLRPRGWLVVTYVNFAHRRPNLYWPYSNIQTPERFRASLEREFVVERQLVTAHNWNHTEPTRWFMRVANMHIDTRLPFVTPRLAVEYAYVCRKRA